MKQYIIRRKKDGQWFMLDNMLICLPSQDGLKAILRVCNIDDECESVDTDTITIPKNLSLQTLFTDEDIAEYGKDQINLALPSPNADCPEYINAKEIVKDITRKHSVIPNIIKQFIDGLAPIISQITGQDVSVISGDEDGPWMISRSDGDNEEMWCGGGEEPVEIPLKKMANQLAEKMNKEDAGHHYEVIRPPKKDGWSMDEILKGLDE